MLDLAAWKGEAERMQVAAAVSVVLDMCEPDAPDERIEQMTSMITRRGYSPAELAYAAEELPFDDFLNEKMKYGKSILPADFERIIKRSRKHRSLLRTFIPEMRLEEILAEHPELKRDDFGVCRKDSNGQSIYVYKKKAQLSHD